MKLRPERHQAFTQALPLSHSEGDCFFAYAGRVVIKCAERHRLQVATPEFPMGNL